MTSVDRNLRFLQTLVFRGCWDIIRQLPESISTLTGLQELNLWGCRILEKLPQLPDSLTSLDLEYCVSVQNLAVPLAGLNRLTTLALGNCPAVRCLPELLAGGLLGLMELVI
jgi:Leucine-rich repeat (LRR) protein